MLAELVATRVPAEVGQQVRLEMAVWEEMPPPQGEMVQVTAGAAEPGGRAGPILPQEGAGYQPREGALLQAHHPVEVQFPLLYGAARESALLMAT